VSVVVDGELHPKSVPASAEFAADFAEHPQGGEAKPAMQRDRCRVGQRDACIGTVEVLVLDGAEQSGIQRTPNAAAAGVRMALDADLDCGAVGRLSTELAAAGIAEHAGIVRCYQQLCTGHCLRNGQTKTGAAQW